MRFTKEEMIRIATAAEARNENPDYLRIMEKFDRVLKGEAKQIRLSLHEKDLISYIFEDPDLDKKLYRTSK